MNNSALCLSIGFILAASLASAQQTTAKLPVRKVVLYKAGVGYFEHLGSVQGEQNVAISFNTGQLNDVLKSLTILDLNGGRISNVGYGSTEPVSRQLAALHLPAGEKATVSEFLAALRGARVEVKSGNTTITGRVLSVESKQRTSVNGAQETDFLTLLSEGGELKTVELNTATSFRFLEKSMHANLEKYLDLVAGARDADVREMVIRTVGSGERKLFVSYISEVPVWKTTYRMVLGGEGTKRKPLLQGWAIVDNTVGEDWEKVELSLVAGSPQSFIQQISRPYYVRRPEVDITTQRPMTPQTFEATLRPGGANFIGQVSDPSGASVANAVVTAFGPNGVRFGEARTDANGQYGLSGLPNGRYTLQFASPGFQTQRLQDLEVSGRAPQTVDMELRVGSVTETVEVATSSRSKRAPGAGIGFGRGGSGSMAATAPTPPPMASLASAIDAARLQTIAQASAQTMGDLFEYSLKEPVSIGKNRSALVPILQTEVELEKVSVWNPSQPNSRFWRALWLTNSSTMTLDEGSISISEGDAFAGEGLMNALRPGEKRLVSYAVDLPLEASSRQESSSTNELRVRLSKGLLTMEQELVEKHVYTMRNEDTKPRVLVVEHPVRPGFALRGGPKPAESTKTFQRFKLNAASKETANLVVEEAKPVLTQVAVGDLSEDQLVAYSTNAKLSPAAKQGLLKVLELQRQVDKIEAEVEAKEAEETKINESQERLRENLKALKSTAEEKALVQRYTAQLSRQEDRLDALKKEQEAAEERKQKAEEALQKFIESLEG